MIPSTQDLHWMHHALSLARRGIGLASPNPAVGCVIVDSNGNLIGEGWHEYNRLDHAEIAAIRNAAGITDSAGCPIHSAGFAEWVGNNAPRLRGSTAYVTLEPCNHTGRTGPCTQALIAAGISRVVAATSDPNPTVAGRGMQTLAAAGIQTTLGLCQAEARRLNEAFARWIQHKRPFVLMKIAMSLDGRIAPPPEARTPGEPFWITSEESRAAVQQLRHQADAVLTGVGTILADDPLLTDRSGLPRRHPLLRVILDSALRTPLDSKIVRSANDDLLIFTASPDVTRAAELRRRGVRVQPVPSSTGRVSLTAVLDHLGSENILTVLTETGSHLNAALLSENLVDRLQVFISPQVLGSSSIPAFQALAEPIFVPDFELLSHQTDLVLTSLLLDPWQISASK
ncbi:bifunctional diaminohydroxyphosphoribosylaminopyrimidine deaminase/5-amino-6-(5-phosphoribosylamino)uracil reductase RibD [Occallatibacter savannae]|uniref:bifunctional diaminohydroxyphosphoribosylaminopyrimidine deaminase/5-amino-6-(5-phosphoribosylamino)uracil reductase RibD n=1 Tax=Occallatibacter savannae TaxID=1002691 RepID=UPI000D694607|nr:bifunctional diaminohydroxyphosphoribosylaminopyrimidine deaminase/5-amino-6-(5-phosphoribosylamino)uracil reductase RibD [Occallatibacter savannae]